MLGINRKNIWHDRGSNPEPTIWKPCCPNTTAVIYFWIKRIGNFGLKKKEKRPYWVNNFSYILHMRRKITKSRNEKLFPKFLWLLWSFSVTGKNTSNVRFYCFQHYVVGRVFDCFYWFWLGELRSINWATFKLYFSKHNSFTRKEEKQKFLDY